VEEWSSSRPDCFFRGERVSVGALETQKAVHQYREYDEFPQLQLNTQTSRAATTKTKAQFLERHKHIYRHAATRQTANMDNF
jgi:hypothetical protein